MHARRTDRARPAPTDQPRPARANTTPAPLPLRDLKARHQEDHLCLRCGHHLVCGMTRALDPNLLVTITNCLGFESAEGDPDICELMPIEAMSTS
jgi:hypothetical protein